MSPHSPKRQMSPVSEKQRKSRGGKRSTSPGPSLAPLAVVVGAFCLLMASGCDRLVPGGGIPEAGPGKYARVGPLGLAVESARNGKVRMRGMMGQIGESRDDVLVLKVRFKLLDTSTRLQQHGLQRDGMMFGAGAMKLIDEAKKEFKPVSGFGMDAVTGRRTGVATLSAETPEITDTLTFESVATATGDLTLEIPATYHLEQADGKFIRPAKLGAFKLRLPRALWTAPVPSIEAGPQNWSTIEPVSVAITSARKGRVSMKGIGLNRGGESQEEVFAISAKVKCMDASKSVKKDSFNPDGMMMLNSPAATLSDAKGKRYKILVGGGFDRVLGRHGSGTELASDGEPVEDLLTFEAAAAEADELILELWPVWQEKQPDGTWTRPLPDGEFRFRIPKAFWSTQQ